jgi:hypothetical protein
MTKKPSCTITFEPVIYEDMENYLRKPGNKGKGISEIVNTLLWDAIHLESIRNDIYKDVKTQEEAQKNLIALMAEGCMFEYIKNLDDETLFRLISITHSFAKMRDIDVNSPYGKYINGQSPLKSNPFEYNPVLSNTLLRKMIKEEIIKENNNNNNNNNNK